MISPEGGAVTASVTIPKSAIEFAASDRFFLAAPDFGDCRPLDEELGCDFGIAPASVAAAGETPNGEMTPVESREVSDGLPDLSSLPGAIGQWVTEQTDDRDRLPRSGTRQGHVTARRNFPRAGGLSSGSGFTGNSHFVFDIGHGVDTTVGGSEGWTETIRLGDGAGSIGELSTDWTLQLDSGSIESSGEGALHLSADASGTVTLDDGSQLHFHEVERIIF